MTLARLDRRAAGLLALIVLTVVWLAAVAPAFAQDGPRFPALTGRVVDDAGLISPSGEQALTAKLEALQRDTSDQLVVVTVPDLQGYEIEDYGYRLGRAWNIGQSQTDNGALLIVAPTERKVRIEVGYGLEPILTDALSALIIQNQILPAFRENQYERGIEQGVAAIDQQLRLDPAEAQARAAAAAKQRPRSESAFSIAPFVIILVTFLVFGVLSSLTRGGRRRRGDLGPILIWAASEALRNSGRGGGGGWGGGGSGGGGFSGGGGSFGGGGASGGW